MRGYFPQPPRNVEANCETPYPAAAPAIKFPSTILEKIFLKGLIA